MSEAFETPELIYSLSDFAHARHAQIEPATLEQLDAQRRIKRERAAPHPTSILFLQILAAADYFTLNKTLMETVPPVLVDVILDPYLMNVFPKSLLPTAGYLVILAVIAWFSSGWIYQVLINLATGLDIAEAQPPSVHASEPKKTR